MKEEILDQGIIVDVRAGMVSHMLGTLNRVQRTRVSFPAPTFVTFLASADTAYR